MARAQGTRAQMAFGFESTYGTPIAANRYWQMPFATSNLGAEQPLLPSELLGYGRDPIQPMRDAISADGDVVVPLGPRHWGVWLKAAFGDPVTTGLIAATGSIAFAAQPAVSSTITINGTAFTFVASGATGNQINIGANLAATLTNIVTVLNASVVPGVALATYAQTGGTTLTVTFDLAGPAGNAFTLAASSAPASNGTVSGAALTGGANSHTFQSGSWTLPSFSVETFMPDVPFAGTMRGCVLNSLTWSMQRAGLANATVGIIAQTETIAAASAVGTLNTLPLSRFSQWQGNVLRNGASIGSVVAAQVTYSNNLDRIDAIRGDGLIDGADPSMASLEGTLGVRFADQTLLAQATAGTPCELQFAYQIDAANLFRLTAHSVFLPRPKVQLQGPGGVQADFAWQAARDPVLGRLCTAVLVNDLANFNNP
jgi:hypothetical protein